LCFTEPKRRKRTKDVRRVKRTYKRFNFTGKKSPISGLNKSAFLLKSRKEVATSQPSQGFGLWFISLGDRLAVDISNQTGGATVSRVCKGNSLTNGF